MNKRFLQKDLPRRLYWALLLGVTAMRLLLAWSQRVQLMTDSSPLDDMLMIRAAQSIVQGNWLGEYGAFTIAKNMGYALWLAALHQLHIPLLLAQAALWIAASAFAVRALRPLFTGNLARLCLFAVLVFNPVAYAGFNQRVYRDAIFPAFCLLLFAGAAGLALRLHNQKLCPAIGMALGMGAGLLGGYLLREDGLVLVIFAVAALIFITMFTLRAKDIARRFVKALLGLLPLAVTAVGVLLFALVNNAYYGVFCVNDLNSGAFAEAYSAMVGVSRSVSGYSGVTPVTHDALLQLYKEVPALAELQTHLEAGPAFNGFANVETGEFGGSFYYGLRVAAQYAGKTPDAQAAQQYWQQVTAEINQAVAQGRLTSTGGGSSVVPRFSSELIAPALQETAYNAVVLLTLEDCSPYPVESTGPQEDIAATAAFLNAKVQSGYVAGTEQPYYNAGQKLLFGFCTLLTPVYAVMLWVLVALALVRVVKALAAGLVGLWGKQGLHMPFLIAIIALGCLCSVLLRLFVAGYMEAAAFQIGTYIMYLASAMPALLVFCALGLAMVPDTTAKVGSKRLAFFGGSKQDKDIRLGWFIILALLLVAVKLVLASAQQIYLNVIDAPLDDGLAISQAMSITAGNWLGEYGWKTLSKHSFFSLWLSWLHAIGVPYLLGGNLLWCAAAGGGALALRPVCKKRWVTLALFAVLLFSPVALANPQPYGYITRVYRDNIFPSLCVLCIAGMLGFALRYWQKTPRLLGWLVISGLAFGAAWLTREDGWWLLPFMVAALAIVVIFIIQSGAGSLGVRLRKCAAGFLPFAILGGCLLGWAATNYQYYGTFVISDFTGGAFARAYGAMTRIEHESWNPKIDVPADVRAQLYAAVPALQELQPLLEGEDYLTRYAGGEDYTSGAFYWALREAAAAAGHYSTPAAAQAYFTLIADGIEAQINNGTLQARYGARVSVNPPIRSEYILPVLQRTLQNFWYVITFQDVDARSILTVPDEETNAPIEAYLHEQALVYAKASSDEPYFNTMQKSSFLILDVLAGLYKVTAPLAFAAALFMQGVGAGRLVKRLRKKASRNAAETLWFLAGLGLLACMLLRCAMIAYVEVSSFTIGIYIMYLASVHPLLLLYAFAGTVCFVRWLVERRNAFTTKPLQAKQL